MTWLDDLPEPLASQVREGVTGGRYLLADAHTPDMGPDDRRSTTMDVTGHRRRGNGLSDDQIEQIRTLEQCGDLTDYDRGTLVALRMQATDPQADRISRLLKRQPKQTGGQQSQEPSGSPLLDSQVRWSGNTR